MNTLPSSLRLVRIEAYVLRYPIATPVRTSFGQMLDRPAVLVRVENSDGAHGWGEIWCNFPSCGAEHRAHLVQSVLAPMASQREFDSPQALQRHLDEGCAVLALQSGEPGPFAQAIAGVDLAVWDMIARRAGLPLWQALGGQHGNIGVYASGINPDLPEQTVQRKRNEGYRAFKLKIGFGRERDRENLARATEAAGPGARFMVDANQAWSLQQACDMADVLNDFDLDWVEEPLRADRPWQEWQALAPHFQATLAAGENVTRDTGFDALLASGAVGVVQPDIAKWGGISASLPIIRRMQAGGLRFCPHYLGGGIGLLHSAHLLAAVGGDGLLEIDANTNPLRTLPGAATNHVRDGRISLGDQPGIGLEPDLRELQETCLAAQAEQAAAPPALMHRAPAVPGGYGSMAL